MSASSPRKPFLAAAVAAVALAVAPLGACGGEETRRAERPGTPSNAEDAAGQDAGRGEAMGPGGTTAVEETPAETARCEQGEELRIGSFERPEGVPPYETLEEEPADRGCVKAVRLLVDTRADDKAGYTLIARDLKAKYRELDAVTVEFTDTSGAFAYDGSALIFNTPSGSDFMGHVYGPPNNDGYYVTVSR